MNKGFTLLELLVVVLIIGILASIALPQYTKAVEKARSTEAIQMLGDLATAEQIYHMGNGFYTNALDELDLEIPGSVSTSVARTRNFEVEILNANEATTFKAAATRIDASGDPIGEGEGPNYALILTIDENGTISRFCASAKTEDAGEGTKYCKSITNSSDGVFH